MNSIRTYRYLGIFLLSTAFACAQDRSPVPDNPPAPPASAPSSTSSNGGWRHMGPPDSSAGPSAAPAPDPAPQSQAPQSQPSGVPSRLTIKSGTYVTVRLNSGLSSDYNHAGDAFSATLVRPIVIDGIVVAERGQTLGGHVTEAKKAGHVSGTSRLGIQLTDIPIVDGSNAPVQTSFVSRNGPTTVGYDVGAVAGTTALGAAIGAAAGWGTGAAIGAGAGAAAGLIGVLLTRGAPTVIPPETALTFRIEQPVTISTENNSYLFRNVEPGDYGTPPQQQARPGPGYRPSAPAPGYGYGYGYTAAPPPPYYGPGYYPNYPYYWPSVGVYFGGYYGPRYYYGPRGYVLH